MSESVVLTRAWGNGADRIEDGETVTTGLQVVLSLSGDDAVPEDTTDKLVACVLDVSQIKAFFMKCDRDILIETNSGSAPGNSISLKAGKAVIWSLNCGLANPLTVDVTALYLTLAAGEDANLELRFAVDPTV